MRRADQDRLVVQLGAGLVGVKDPGADLACLRRFVVAVHEHRCRPGPAGRGERELKPG